MEKLAVVGAGAMGRQIALHSALAGVKVVLTDSRTQALTDADAFNRQYLEGRIAKGKLQPEEVEQALGRLRVDSSLADAVKDATVVIEAIIEDFEIKADLFRQLDQLCGPDTLLTTNSSNIRASRLAEVTKRPSHVLNLHFFNPVLVMELVEVVIHDAVPEDVVQRAMGFCRAIRKLPVLLRKELPGFIVNRIFRALTREAISLIEGGYASAEDIDLAVTRGLGHPMGPLRLLDMVGVDVSYLARVDEYRETGAESARPADLMKAMYERNEWGMKTGKGFYEYPQSSAAGAE